MYNENRQVSHETIYKTLFIQARGALKKEPLAHLRLTKAMRQPRGHTQKNRQIKEAVSIRERPAEAEDRAVPGHWGGDLLIGSNSSQSPPWWNAKHATACWYASKANIPKR